MVEYCPDLVDLLWFGRLMQDEVVNFDDEEEADPVFVLTDEWRDFFAKSEAKRRLGIPFSPLSVFGFSK